MRNFSIIAAVDQNMGMSRDGEVPWYLPDDLTYFLQVTKDTENPDLKNVVIMDEEAWNMLPSRVKPFSGRINAVISNNDELDLPEEVLQFASLDDALSAIDTSRIIESIFVIGGVNLYEEAVLHPDLERIFLTRIEDDYDCDTFFPDQIPDEFDVVSSTETLEDEGIEYSFVILQRGGEDADEESFSDFSSDDQG